MPRRPDAPLILAMLLGALGAACHRQPARTTPAPAWAIGHYCWWAVLRSPLPPDSVAAHFQRAYAAVGLTDAMWTQRADTAWAHAGPSALGGQIGGAQYESRAVAYRRGDSTHFRYYVSIAPPPAASAQPSDTVDTSGASLAFCGDVARTVGFRWSAPRDPTGEESLPVWTRQP
jgi:hypothetical protein